MLFSMAYGFGCGLAFLLVFAPTILLMRASNGEAPDINTRLIEFWEERIRIQVETNSLSKESIKEIHRIVVSLEAMEEIAEHWKLMAK